MKTIEIIYHDGSKRAIKCHTYEVKQITVTTRYGRFIRSWSLWDAAEVNEIIRAQ